MSELSWSVRFEVLTPSAASVDISCLSTRRSGWIGHSRPKEIKRSCDRQYLASHAGYSMPHQTLVLHGCLIPAQLLMTWLRTGRIKTYLLPRKAHTPQFPQLRSVGSISLRSHRKLLNLFSPGSIKMSTSPAIFSSTHCLSLCISHSVYPVLMIGTLVSNNCGRVSSHSCTLAGCPRPGWKSTKQSK